jgi:hypothetical protein
LQAGTGSKPKNMSDKQAHSRNFAYPDNTSGSRAAKKVRSEANKLNDDQRRELLETGMRIIYGGSDTKKTVGCRH